MKDHITVLDEDFEKEIILRLIKIKNPKELLQLLCDSMFADYRFRRIYSICQELYEKDGLIDILTLSKLLKTEEQQALLKESEYTITANYQFYVKKLHQAYFNRLIKDATTLDEMKQAEQEINKWQDTSALTLISSNSEDLLVNYYDKWETAIKTGFNSFDNVLGAMQGGDFMILAGATSSGKTMVSLNIMLNMAKSGNKCSFYSLEMPINQLQNRIISHETGINAAKYRNFTMTEEEQKKYLAYTEDEFKKLPIFVYDKPNLTVDKIIALEKKCDSEVVFIDYLGLLTAQNGNTQYEKITEISTSLKRAAMEVNKPFIVLHQLNRDNSDRKDKRPLLSDLRGSGQLEQDADFVVFVYRPAYYDDTADKSDLQLIIAKNRHGEAGKILPFSYLSGQQKIMERGVTVWN